MTLNNLAEKTLTTKGELTEIIARLEKKGLVRREVFTLKQFLRYKSRGNVRTSTLEAQTKSAMP